MKDLPAIWWLMMVCTLGCLLGTLVGCELGSARTLIIEECDTEAYFYIGYQAGEVCAPYVEVFHDVADDMCESEALADGYLAAREDAGRWCPID